MHLPPFRLERYYARREFAAPYMLSASDCESMSVAELLALGDTETDALHRLRLGYTETAGSPQLREAITALYADVGPDEVLVHSAGEEAIFTFMLAALGAGDHAIVHVPCYQSLLELPRSLGCEVTPWEAHENREWRLDLDFLCDAIRPNTRIIVVNCPHNPTGYSMSLDEWGELFAIADEYDLVVFADEAYRGIEHRVADRLPAACDLYPRAVSLSVVSKGMGLPGLRIGWLATHHTALLEDIARIKDYTTICTSAPAEFLATIALKRADAIFARNRVIVLENLARLRCFMQQHQDRIAWIPPVAGPVTFPRFVDPIDIDGYCARVLETVGVLLLPGTVFDPESSHFRLGLGRCDFATGLKLLAELLP